MRHHKRIDCQHDHHIFTLCLELHNLQSIQGIALGRYHKRVGRGNRANMSSVCAYQDSTLPSKELSYQEKTNNANRIFILCIPGHHLTRYRVVKGYEQEGWGPTKPTVWANQGANSTFTELSRDGNSLAFKNGDRTWAPLYHL